MQRDTWNFPICVKQKSIHIYLYINRKNSSKCLWKEVERTQTHFTIYFCSVWMLTMFVYYFSTKTKINDRKNWCFYEQSTAIGANILNSLPLPPRKLVFVIEEEPCAHAAFLLSRNGSAVSLQVSGRRRESMSHWGEQKSCRREAAWELDLEVFHWGSTGLNRVSSGPELPGLQLAPANDLPRSWPSHLASLSSVSLEINWG